MTLLKEKMQDTGLHRTNTLDQFYTKCEVAKSCVDTLLKMYPKSSTYYWIEPSVGSGAFIKNVPTDFETIGIDIDPKCIPALKENFLTWTPSVLKKTLLFGNPPFGRQSSLAKKFIRHGSIFSDIIAFILPRSFTKPSMSNVFPPHFHCVHEEALKKDSFEVDGRPYDVPCVFQIWERRDEPREVPQNIEPIGFRYVKSTEPHDLVFRRVGVNAGKCQGSGGNPSPQSHYFIKFDRSDLNTVTAKLNEHVFPSNTVGPRSISKSEANAVINRVLEETF